jgi:hypothetical protein
MAPHQILSLMPHAQSPNERGRGCFTRKRSFYEMCPTKKSTESFIAPSTTHINKIRLRTLFLGTLNMLKARTRRAKVLTLTYTVYK